MIKKGPSYKVPTRSNYKERDTMLTEHHNFVDEHPEHKEKIHNLKTNDGHFNKLYAQYGEINKEILRIEKEVETSSDERLESLKKKRLKLNDEMMSMLTKVA